MAEPPLPGSCRVHPPQAPHSGLYLFPDPGAPIFPIPFLEEEDGQFSRVPVQAGWERLCFQPLRAIPSGLCLCLKKRPTGYSCSLYWYERCIL